MNARMIFVWFAISLLTSLAIADTPPPGAVFVKGGTDSTKIGNVSDALKVTGTFFQAVQPVSQSGTWTVLSTQNGAWTTGRTWTLSSGSDSVSASISNFPALQSVNLTQILSATPSATNALPARITNGTTFVDPTQIRLLTSSDVVTADQGGSWVVTANAGTGTFQTNVTNSSIPVTQSTSPWVVSGTVTVSNPSTNYSLETGGHLASIDSKITTTANGIKVDGSAVTQPVSGTVAVSNFPATQAVTQSTSPWVVSGTVSATQGTSPWVTSRNWTLASGTDSVAAVQSGTWTVQQGTPPWSVSQSGTWNINNISGTISLPTGAATSANQTTANTSLSTIASNQTNATQKTQIVDGSGNVIASSSNALNVNQVSAVAVPGRVAVTNTINNYSTTNVTTSAFVTLITSTAQVINQVNIFDSSGQTLYLAYAATCGALSIASNSILIFPGGSGLVSWQIPASQCVGIQAQSANATSGVSDITYLK